MAIRAEELLRVHLDQLSIDQFPADHPERRFVQAQADAFAAFNAAIRDGSALASAVETPAVPTAESITAHLRGVWAERGSRIGKTYDVPELSATPDQLAEIYQDGRRISYVPRGIKLADLGKMFPDMRSWATSDGTLVRSDQSKGGYFAVEASVDAPNLRTNEDQLRTLFTSIGITLPTYIVASQDSKLETGHYFDERGTWSRVLGSRHGGHVVDAYFLPGGNLSVYSDLFPQFVNPNLGGRSQEAVGS